MKTPRLRQVSFEGVSMCFGLNFSKNIEKQCVLNSPRTGELPEKTIIIFTHEVKDGMRRNYTLAYSRE